MAGVSASRRVGVPGAPSWRLRGITPAGLSAPSGTISGAKGVPGVLGVPGCVRCPAACPLATLSAAGRIKYSSSEQVRMSNQCPVPFLCTCRAKARPQAAE